ncbi:hypothetical protein GLU64_00120 [Nanohaloarchaea archaeon]|nr:hypothetical protein [Candidatus Nanohaloarchaea archaeon]
MPREVSLYADIHTNEELAENIQRCIEVQNPDVVMHEWLGSNASDKVEAVQDYRTMEDVYEAFGLSEEYQNTTISDTPLYALGGSQFTRLFEPVRNYLAENLSDIAEEENLPSEQQKALNAVKTVYGATKNGESNLDTRLIDSAQFMDTDVFSIETRDLRVKMFEYGAENIDKLPDDPKEVKKAAKKYRTGNLMQVQMTGSKPQIKGVATAEGSEQLFEEYNQIRNQKMAESVERTMKQNEYENAAVAVGGNHIEEVHEELPDEWDVTSFYLAGEPSKWSVGTLNTNTMQEKYNAGR